MDDVLDLTMDQIAEVAVGVAERQVEAATMFLRPVLRAFGVDLKPGKVACDGRPLARRPDDPKASRAAVRDAKLLAELSAVGLSIDEEV